MSLQRLHEHGDVMVLRTTLSLKTGRNPGGLLHFCPGLIRKKPEVLFLSNGFSANHKTFTFRPRIPNGGYSDSCADFLARWGYIVMVKDIRSDRTRIEPTFEDHMQHVPHYAETTLRIVAHELSRFFNKPFTVPHGVHWIGHSMGGMEVMPALNRSFITSLTTIASPTYMISDEAQTMRLAHFLGNVLGVRQKFKNVPLNTGLLSKITDALFKALRVESGKSMSPQQEMIVRWFLGLPYVRLAAHNFLNVDHLDMETAVAFFRTALSDETLHLVNEFAVALLKGDDGRGEVLGHPIQRLNIPTLVISGRGDQIAPPQSNEDLLDFVDHPCRRALCLEEYDHLGLLVRYGAEDHVWPHIVLFLHEQKLHAPQPSIPAARQARKTAESFLGNPALGAKCRDYAQNILKRCEKILKTKKTAPKTKRKK